MERSRVPELMDDPGLDRDEHEKALRGLRRLNIVSGAANAIWNAIRSELPFGTDRLSILDVATGSGDVPIALALKAALHGVDFSIAGCDFSAQAVDVARENAQKYGVPVEFFQLNVITDPLPRKYDVILTSLFTHHLDADQVVQLLQKLRDHAPKLIVVNDLERSKVSYAAVWLATRLLSTSRVVHFDGPVSVKAAYTAAELLDLAHEAGLPGAKIKTQFPCRLLLTAVPSVNRRSLK